MKPIKKKLLKALKHTCRPYVYGEDKKHRKRVFLLYNGIHYDAVVGTLSPVKPTKNEVKAKKNVNQELETPQTLFEFDTASARAKVAFSEVRAMAEAAKATKQFVNVATFTLRCGQCGQGFKGAKEAQAHAQATGHVQFTQC
jgi:ubiquitin thioesterase OTU1